MLFARLAQGNGRMPGAHMLDPPPACGLGQWDVLPGCAGMGGIGTGAPPLARSAAWAECRKNAALCIAGKELDDGRTGAVRIRDPGCAAVSLRCNVSRSRDREDIRRYFDVITNDVWMKQFFNVAAVEVCGCGGGGGGCGGGGRGRVAPGVRKTSGPR